MARELTLELPLGYRDAESISKSCDFCINLRYIIEFKMKGETYTQDIVSLEQAKTIVKTGEGEIIQTLADGSILVKRRKKVDVNTDEEYSLLQQLEDEQGTFGVQEVIQAKYGTMKVG